MERTEHRRHLGRACRRDRDRDRDRGGSGAYRDNRPRGPPPSSAGGVYDEDRARREKEKEFQELERAGRTVFITNLHIKCDPRDDCS